jgi:type IV pilus assembly protein PilC
MPLMTATFFVGIMIFLITVILPQFKKIFVMLKTPLPASTQFLFKIADAMSVSNIIFFAAGLFIASVSFITLRKTGIAHKIADNFLLYFPGVRSIYQDLARAQCLQSLALLLRSGRTLADALVLVAESFNNVIVREQLKNVQQEVQTGKPLTQAIHACPLLSIPEIKNCLAIAHETAELEIVLQQLSIISRTRALKKLDRLTLFIQPVLLICLGAAIGGMLLALYVPLLQIPQMI